jgi:hypothetical protein
VARLRVPGLRGQHAAIAGCGEGVLAAPALDVGHRDLRVEPARRIEQLAVDAFGIVEAAAPCQRIGDVEAELVVHFFALHQRESFAPTWL